VKTAANQWLLSEYYDPDITLSLNTFDAHIPIIDIYENIDRTYAKTLSNSYFFVSFVSFVVRFSVTVRKS
jgi:hypothetical protein